MSLLSDIDFSILFYISLAIMKFVYKQFVFDESKFRYFTFHLCENLWFSL